MATPLLSPKHRQQLRAFAPDHLKVIDGMAREQRQPKKAAKPPEPSPDFVLDLSDIQTKLTVADLEDIEDATDMPALDVFANLGQRRFKGLAAIVWVLRRKDDPSYTLEQARNLSMVKSIAVLGGKPKEDASPLGPDASPTA